MPGPSSGIALVLMSGGIDSTACAQFLTGQGFDVKGLFVDYGQSARTLEGIAVSAVAESLGIPLERASFVSQRIYGAGEIVGRNGLLAMAALITCSSTTRIIAMGIHSGTPYYDCSPAFAERIDFLMQECTSGATRYLAPFLNWAKQDIYDYCRQQRLDLSATYSCEVGIMPPCGHCASCRDRQGLNVR